MRSLRARPALRYGIIAAIVNAALLGVDQAVRALNPTIIQSPQGHRTLSIAFFACVALVTLVLGYRIALGAGRLKAAMWAGALAVGLPAALLGILPSARTLATLGEQFQTDFVAIIILTCLGALAGAVVALLGGLVGWLRYRQTHREELAAQAIQRAATREKIRQKRRRERLGFAGWLQVGALLVVTMAPMGLSYLALENLGKWVGLAAAAGALLVGLGLLRLANNRARWQGYLYDFVSLTLIVSALIVGIGEITGYAIPLLAGIGPTAYIWRGMDRSLGIRKPSVTEAPELAPVLFRYDGESIVVYPSRRKLAGHALFSGGLTVVMGGLAYVFRDAGPVLVFGLGVFALMGLLFGLIPDLARLLHPWPTLTVTSDGVTDRGSGLITGFGLIPWHEIFDIRYTTKTQRAGFSYLWIIPASRERLLARQSRIKRLLLRLVTAMTGSVGIASLYLAQSPVEVATRIREYVRSHAPASYFEDEDAGEDTTTQHPAADDPAG